MRILLIDPPYERLVGFRSEWFPFGLASIAAYLVPNGYDDVLVYHGEHAADTEYQSVVKYAESFHRYKDVIESPRHPVWEEVAGVVKDFRPDVVGLSVLTPKVPSALRIAAICKDINPQVKVVGGGCHPNVRPEELLADRHVDFVVRGEGEETFLRLLKALESPAADFQTIEGLSFKNHQGDIVHNRTRALIGDLDAIPAPARERLHDVETYSPAQLSMVMTSRGCPYNCAFCASDTLWERKVRFRSVDNVIEEIRELKHRYGVRNICFMDDAFTVDPKRVEAICRALIAAGLDITWSCLTRVNMINDDIIALMKKAGCIKVDVGVESGNERVLKLINKRITPDQVRRAVAVLRKNRMFWSGFFMFGFPTETEEEVADTLRFLKELKPDWANMSIFTPYPGTRLYDLAKERGMITEPVDYTLYSHQNPYARSSDTIPVEKFAPLAKYILGEVHRYNRSVRHLVKRAMSRQYHKNPKLLVSDLNKVLTWVKS